MQAEREKKTNLQKNLYTFMEISAAKPWIYKLNSFCFFFCCCCYALDKKISFQFVQIIFKN